MPFVSKKQAAWGHSLAGLKALGGAERVKEWDSGTNYKNLPQHVVPKKVKKKMLHDIIDKTRRGHPKIVG